MAINLEQELREEKLKIQGLNKEYKQLEVKNEKLNSKLKEFSEVIKRQAKDQTTKYKRIVELEEYIKELSKMMRKITDMNTKVVKFMYEKTS